MNRAASSAAEALGRHGEELAARYLQLQGMRVLARNWHGDGGELDIVATWGPVLVAAEVKTRSGTRFGDPLESADQDKLRRVRRLARAWAAAQPRRFARIRVDAVGVLLRPGGRWYVRHQRGVG